MKYVDKDYDEGEGRKGERERETGDETFPTSLHPS